MSRSARAPDSGEVALRNLVVQQNQEGVCSGSLRMVADFGCSQRVRPCSLSTDLPNGA